MTYVVNTLVVVALLLLIVGQLVSLNVLGVCRGRNEVWGTPCRTRINAWRFRCHDHARRRR